MKDWRGNEITIGSRVVYPGRARSHMWLNEAEVVELLPQTVRRWSTSNERMTEVEEGELKVRRLYRTGYGADRHEPVDQKIVKIDADRVTVVTA